MTGADIIDWRDRAACRDADPDLFFPNDPEASDLALSVCSRCPVRDDCLAYALEHHERHGVWGGLGEQQRAALVVGWVA